MSRMADPTPPWRVIVAVDQIPNTGLHQEIVADDAQRNAIKDLAHLRELFEVVAVFDLRPAGQGRVRVVGRIQGKVGQICVVTLEPLDNEIDESVDLIFAPEDQLASIAKVINDDKENGHLPDSPEAIVNGTIDLGKLATDILLLGISPYPRKADAIFESPVAVENPEDHSFAALKVLKDNLITTAPKNKDS